MLSLQRALRLGYLGDDGPPPVEEDTAEAPPGAILQPIVGASAAQQAAWANQAAAVGNTSAGDAAGGGGVYAAANIPEGQSSMQAAAAPVMIPQGMAVAVGRQPAARVILREGQGLALPMVQ